MNLSYKFFTIPIQSIEYIEEDLNQFIQTHRIIKIERKLITHTNESFWCIAIDYEKIKDKKGVQHKKVATISCIFFLAPIGATACSLGLQPQVHVIFFLSPDRGDRKFPITLKISVAPIGA